MVFGQRVTSNTLDELERDVIGSIADGRRTIDALAVELATSRQRLVDRLDRLVDNGLVLQDDTEEYELSESGLRLLNATPEGEFDNQIDTPPSVERAIEAFDLPPDETAAVRNAFSFLHYWGEATTAEIIDASYSETPAGYDTSEMWWIHCVRTRLASLPDVEWIVDESIDGGGDTWGSDWWLYGGTAVVDRIDGTDGRSVRDPPSAPDAVGSVRHGLERLDLNGEERTAARVAFAYIHDRGIATASEVVEEVYEEYPAGYNSRNSDRESSADWTNWLSSVFDTLNAVERIRNDEEIVWSYGGRSRDRVG